MESEKKLRCNMIEHFTSRYVILAGNQLAEDLKALKKIGGKLKWLMLRLQFKFDNLKIYENLIYFKVTGTLSMKVAKKSIKICATTLLFKTACRPI